jgi:membrane-anchored glycerophosphoryl diester phosphodiesterase (GDPDase)
MKKISGVLLIIFAIALFAVIIFRVWGINLISWQDILRSSVTVLLLVVLVIVVIIVYFLFLKNQDK